MNFNDIISKITTGKWSLTNICVLGVKFIIVVVFIHAIYLLYRRSLYHKAYFTHKAKEGFQDKNGVIRNNDNNITYSLEQTDKYVEKKGLSVFDKFYVDFYDDIVYDEIKNRFELDTIFELTGLNKKDKREIKLLDLGSGTGHHLHAYKMNNINAVGIDNSKAIIQHAKESYANLNIKYGDFTNPYIFSPNEFSHIQCLYFTIYYVKNKKQVFDNVYRWLKSGGYFILHLVDREEFDPIVNTADPLHMVSAQKYAKNRINNSIIQFKGISYKAEFDLDTNNNSAKFVEVFKDDENGNIRKNIHELYMPKRKNIVQQVLNAGFNMKSEIHMVKCQYEYQYLYIFVKE